jgi:ribosomal protein S18 acetylase RimI-like enzyme
MVLERGDWVALIVQNLVPGLVAIALTGLAVRGWNKAQNLYVEYQYPISGTYVTRFVDSIADERDSEIYSGSETYTAVAELEQDGDRITGRSWMDYRTFSAEWSLDAEITDDGHLVGEYIATSPHDQGRGTFFLYIRKNRLMEGVWTGYEDEGGEINYGEYEFRPVIESEIGPITDGTRPAAVHLLTRTGARERTVRDVGDGGDREGFTLLAQPGPRAGVPQAGQFGRFIGRLLFGRTPENTGSTYDDGPLGVVVGSVLSDRDHEAWRAAGDLPTALACADSIGFIDHIGVVEKYRRHGVGTELVEAAVHRFDRMGVDVLCLHAMGEEQAAVDGIMNNQGFRRYDGVSTPDGIRDRGDEAADDQALYVRFR